MSRAEQALRTCRELLASIVGDDEYGKVYLAEDAPAGLIANIHRALDLSAETPRVDPAAKESK